MAHTPFLSQMETTECGAACLAMVLAHHGHSVSLSEVRKACGVSRDGASAAAILRAAKSYQLVGVAHRLEPRDLVAGPFPAILHWDFNHFVVLTNAGSFGLDLLDPAVGPRRVSWTRADDCFTGVRLSFKPAATFVKKRALSPRAGRYRAALREAFGGLGLVMLAALVLELLALVFPVASQVAIDYVIRPRQTRLLFALGAVLLVAASLRLLLAQARNRIMAGLRVALDRALVTAFVEHLVHMPLDFFAQRSAGDLSARVDGHAAIRDLVRTLSTTALDALLVASYSALMLAYHARLGALVITMNLLRVLLGWLLQRFTRDQAATEVAARARQASAIVEAFAAPEAVKAFRLETRLLDRYSSVLVDQVNASSERERIQQGFLHVLPVLDALCMAIVYGYGGYLVANDRITVGVLSAFASMAILVSRPLSSLVDALSKLPELAHLSRRLDDVWEIPREPRGCVDPGRLSGAVVIRDLTVRHGDGAVVLDGASLTLAAGERVAIVGPSGSGKSTLALAIAGLLPRTGGELSLDGHDIATIDSDCFRSQVSLVVPDTLPFVGSVRENLVLGEAQPGIAELERAARLACIDAELRRLPDGYETKLDSDGAPLSGGQRQRLALARALLRRPRILIVDEATASLDAPLEERVLENLLGIDATQIVITHRVSAMRASDRVIVLDRGRVVDSGSFPDVASRCDVLAKMLRAHGEVAL